MYQVSCMSTPAACRSPLTVLCIVFLQLLRPKMNSRPRNNLSGQNNLGCKQMQANIRQRSMSAPPSDTSIPWGQYMCEHIYIYLCSASRPLCYRPRRGPWTRCLDYIVRIAGTSLFQQRSGFSAPHIYTPAPIPHPRGYCHYYYYYYY